MHILVIGATGPSGVAFVDEALKAGHELTIYARNPRKLSPEVLKNPKVHVIQGTFEDESAARAAVTGGAESLVSLAGPISGNKGLGTPIKDLYERLYSLILSESGSKIRHCLILSTPSFPSSSDVWSLKWSILVNFIWTVANFAYNEIIACGKLTVSQPVDKLGWTLFRVPFLTNGKAGPVQAGFGGQGNDGMFLSRQGMAIWLLSELEAHKYVGQAPILSNR